MTIILINFFPFVPTGSFFNNWLSTLYFIPLALLFHELKVIKLRVNESFIHHCFPHSTEFNNFLQI